MTELKDKHCRACSGEEDALSQERIDTLLPQVEGWSLTDDGKGIERRFEFKGFYKTVAFINAMAWIANSEGHHPDFSAGYNFCHVQFTTHDVGGLYENDFICAAKVNDLLNS